MKTLIDAGPIYAMINHREYYHRWATDQASRLERPFYTCEAVISEAHFLLKKVHNGSRQLNELVETGRLVLAFSYAEHIDRVHALMDRYANVPISFADACLVRMAEIHRDGRAFTTDGDFRIYRKHRTEPLNVIMPH